MVMSVAPLFWLTLYMPISCRFGDIHCKVKGKGVDLVHRQLVVMATSRNESKIITSDRSSTDKVLSSLYISQRSAWWILILV